MNEKVFEALTLLDKTSLHYSVDFQGQFEIMQLIDWLRKSEYEFDHILADLFEDVLGSVTSKDQANGIIIKYGKEYQTCIYVELIETYGLTYFHMKKIQQYLDWKAGEITRHDQLNRLILRVCWVDGLEY